MASRALRYGLLPLAFVAALFGRSEAEPADGEKQILVL